MKPTLILINPWVYDFAAYDLWSKPLGLLYLASQLRALGLTVHLIDCLDVHNPLMEKVGSIKNHPSIMPEIASIEESGYYLAGPVSAVHIVFHQYVH